MKLLNHYSLFFSNLLPSKQSNNILNNHWITPKLNIIANTIPASFVSIGIKENTPVNDEVIK